MDFTGELITSPIIVYVTRSKIHNRIIYFPLRCNSSNIAYAVYWAGIQFHGVQGFIQINRHNRCL